MSESAIHHAEHGAADPMSRRVGVMVAMLGILLAVVTISSHRAHTAAVVRRTEANDEHHRAADRRRPRHHLQHRHLPDWGRVTDPDPARAC